MSNSNQTIKQERPVSEMRRRLAAKKATLHARSAAFSELGVRPMDVRLAGKPVGWYPTYNQKMELELQELCRPWVLLWLRDGYPPVLLCGNSEAECHTTPARPGPNGPIDCVRWLRRQC